MVLFALRRIFRSVFDLATDRMRGIYFGRVVLDSFRAAGHKAAILRLPTVAVATVCFTVCFAIDKHVVIACFVLSPLKKGTVGCVAKHCRSLRRVYNNRVATLLSATAIDLVQNTVTLD